MHLIEICKIMLAIVRPDLKSVTIVNNGIQETKICWPFLQLGATKSSTIPLMMLVHRRLLLEEIPYIKDRVARKKF